MNKKEAIKYLKSKEWIEYSCGRSTDYLDEFYSEGSIINLIEMIDKIFGEELSK